MIKYLISMLISFFPACIYSQVISGKIYVDGNQPAEAVVVTLSADTVTGTMMTDSNGLFRFQNLKHVRYKLRITSTGYFTEELSFLFSRDTTIDVWLRRRSENLKEIEILGRKRIIEQKIDRVVFNVENSLTATGTDALEAIGKAPRVRLQNDNISIIGKSGVKIMINDRLLLLSGTDLAAYLRTIPADNISRIEVITNPPAKYDAEGNNGLINIVLKKNKREDGYKGSVTAGYRQSTYSYIYGNTNLNYRKGRSNLHVALDAGNGSSLITDKRFIYYPEQTWTTANNRRDYNRNLSGQANWDYRLSQKTLLGITYGTGIMDPAREESIQTAILDSSETIDSTIFTNAKNDEHKYFHSVNLHLDQSFDSLGKKLTVDADWFTFLNKSERPFSNVTYLGDGLLVPNSLTNYLSDNKQGVTYYTLNTVLDIPCKTFKLSVGGKLSFVENNSDVFLYKLENNYRKLDSTGSNQFKYTERIQAVFGNFSKAVDNWDFQIGLRGENTQTAGRSFSGVEKTNTNRYVRIFPTVYILYKINAKNALSLTYGKRIHRPGYFNLNPFKWYTNPYSYSEGNPFLQPSINNNYELSYTYNDFLITSFSFGKETDKYDQLTLVQDNDHIQITKPLNFITGYSYQLSNSISLNQIKWLESNNQVLIYYNVSKTNMPQTPPATHGWGAYVSTDNQVVLNKRKTILGGIKYWYQFPEISGIDRVRSSQGLDLAVKILFLNKKWQLTVNGADVQRTNRSRFSSVVNGIRQAYYNYYDDRRFRITLMYSFGNNKIKNPARKQAKPDEQNRVY